MHTIGLFLGFVDRRFLRRTRWSMVSRALQEQRIVFRVSGRRYNDRLARGARVWHFSHIANQECHPFVRLQYFHCLVVGRLLETLPIHLDDLITHLDTKIFSPYFLSVFNYTVNRAI